MTAATDAWAALAARWYPEDPFRPTMPGVREHYTAKAEVADVLNPRSIFEFGVRAGYSLFAMAYPLSRPFLMGVDANVEPLAWQEAHMWQVLDQHTFAFMRCRSEQIDELPGLFDLVHVDGNHSYEGCKHDMQLAVRYGRWVLVDDYLAPGADGIRQACREVCYGWDRTATVLEEPLRGCLLIHPAGVTTSAQAACLQEYCAALPRGFA